MDDFNFDLDFETGLEPIDEDQLLLNDATAELLKKTQMVLDEFDPDNRKNLKPTLGGKKSSNANSSKNNKKGVAQNAKVNSSNQNLEDNIQPAQNNEISKQKNDSKSAQIAQNAPKNEAEPEKSETFYVNVADFVVSYLSKVYAKETTKTANSIWLNDWWAYPAIVTRINSIWMSWERLYKANQLDTWFLHNAEPMMQNLMNKEVGVMVHYAKLDNSNLVNVKRGDYLPTVTPPMEWYQNVADELSSIGRKEIERQKVAAQAAQEIFSGFDNKVSAKVSKPNTHIAQSTNNGGEGEL